MRHDSGDAVICYNGEIYNYLEIAQRLRAAGVPLVSQSDTEVLLEAYRLWGDAFLRELNGMFSFALYDARRERLICARDRYGEKPFLYATTEEAFAFASEYKALLSLSEVNDHVAPIRALRFLATGVGLDDERETAFPAIQQLLPGEYLTLDLATLRAEVHRYWTIERDSNVERLSFADAAGRFRELLADSVQLRRRSDVPVGSCLSGGLDSGTIVALAREQLGDRPYHAFSGRFPGTAADEGPYIDALAETAHVIRHEVEPQPGRLLEELPSFIWHNELPVGSGSQYAQWCVFRLARQQGVVVLLDGQGGDELLGGYEQYFRRYFAEPDSPIGEREAVRRRYPRALPTLSEQIKMALPTALRPALARWSGKGSDPLFGMTPAVVQAIGGAPSGRDGGFAGLKGALFEESFHTVLPTLLRYGDRNSMAHSVEVRLPFCDHRLAEFVFSLPPSYLMGDVQTKRLLREATRGLLPELVRTRWNKQGFVPPQDVWMAEGLLAAAEEAIEDPAFAQRGYWNAAWWRRAVRRLRAGEGHLAAALWKVLIAETWQRHFVERVRRGEKLSIFCQITAHASDLRQSLPS
jgi:asparagine synthase (glutamine-hydrolysing)